MGKQKLTAEEKMARTNAILEGTVECQVCGSKRVFHDDSCWYCQEMTVIRHGVWP